MASEWVNIVGAFCLIIIGLTLFLNWEVCGPAFCYDYYCETVGDAIIRIFTHFKELIF